VPGKSKCSAQISAFPQVGIRGVFWPEQRDLIIASAKAAKTASPVDRQIVFDFDFP
jgi:hypothetical protein